MTKKYGIRMIRRGSSAWLVGPPVKLGVSFNRRRVRPQRLTPRHPDLLQRGHIREIPVRHRTVVHTIKDLAVLLAGFGDIYRFGCALFQKSHVVHVPDQSDYSVVQIPAPQSNRRDKVSKSRQGNGRCLDNGTIPTHSAFSP